MQTILSSIITDLKTALEKKEHPFRYFTLASSSINGTPRLRTVVLRTIDEDLNISIYTDSRSKKITHITAQNNVSMLFFDPQKMVQISIRAKAKIITDPSFIKPIWDQVPQHSRKDYSSLLPPGTAIENPEKIDVSEEKHFFCVLKMIPNRIEHVQLGRVYHTRSLFKKENNQWKGSFLTP